MKQLILIRNDLENSYYLLSFSFVTLYIESETVNFLPRAIVTQRYN